MKVKDIVAERRLMNNPSLKIQEVVDEGRIAEKKTKRTKAKKQQANEPVI